MCGLATPGGITVLPERQNTKRVEGHNRCDASSLPGPADLYRHGVMID